MKEELSKRYDPAEFEQRWYQSWEGRGYFTPVVDREKPGFSIVMPPPNVTGRLHIGHALVNALTDILVRWKRMSGFNTLWVPGTDHAGIATQMVVERELAKEGLSRIEMGREKFLERVWIWKEQHKSFIKDQLVSLGASCDWTRERFTLDESLSRAVRHVFVRLYEDGLIYRDLAMVNWCPRCRTAISDIEVEYKETTGKLYLIDYPIEGPIEGETRKLTVATTRPETMLGDTAVAVHPDDERYRGLIGKRVRLPLTERTIQIIGDSILVDPAFGTGLVKITPAHDRNDYEAGLRHRLEQIVVIDEAGKMTAAAGPRFAGLDRFEARKAVLAALSSEGLIRDTKDHQHSIATCAKCETIIEPMISRQWFVKIAPLAEPAIEVVRNRTVRLVPESWESTYFDWMENIHDWCISRQRLWGVPITVLFCEKCNRQITDRAFFERVVESFAREGADSWFERPAADFLPNGHRCTNCGHDAFRKEFDILDVWFDSGCSHIAVAKQREEIGWPVALYMEGHDQHRGWFQSSLLIGTAIEGGAPYEHVITHGFVVDEKGRKMSKSLGTGVAPQEVIKQNGADILRLWVSMIDYRDDMGLSKEIIARIADSYRKIRNTARFLLGNLSDFDPAKNAVSPSKMEDLDRWAVARAQETFRQCREAYESFELHTIYHRLLDLCTVDLSAVYLDILKDRLYVEPATSPQRRSAQTAMHTILSGLVSTIAPILPFTADEIYELLPGKSTASVHLTDFPSFDEESALADAEVVSWARIFKLREAVTGVLEKARAAGDIGQSLEADIVLSGVADPAFLTGSVETDLSKIFIVSHVDFEGEHPEGSVIVEVEGIGPAGISMRPARGTKCGRCWHYREEVVTEGDLCERCAPIVALVEATG